MLPRVYFELGMVYRLTNRSTEALRGFQQALAALEGDPLRRGDRYFFAEIKCNLGHILYDGERYSEALSALSEIVWDLPRPYPYYYTLATLGHCYLAMGQHSKARNCYEEVLASESAPDEDKAAAREGLSRLPPTSGARTH